MNTQDKMDLNNKQQEVVVVEGYHDLATLKRIFPSLDVVITNGSEISPQTLQELKQLNKQRGLILFLDPDVQGERIRRMINEFVGPTKHAFLPKEKCISTNRKKVGIEHAKDDDIRQALKELKHSKLHLKNNLTIQDLYRLDLIGSGHAKERRKQLTESLGIGFCNGKTLLRKCHMFGINIDIIKQHIKR